MFKDKKVLVVGMARSGIAAAERLIEVGAKVIINDSKTEEEIGEVLSPISNKVFKKILGGQPRNMEEYDLVVLSPGVPKHLPFIVEAYDKNVEVIGELELGYLLSKGTFYGITGTNGKTTTTTLTYEIFKKAYEDVYAVGNIGKAVVSVSKDTNDDTHMITEVSSFQLESVNKFNVHIAAVLNLAPDHLNRHKTMENYVDAKCNLFKNQTPNDYLILNYDDEMTRELSNRKVKSKIIYFSKSKLPEGAYVDSGVIYFDDTKIMEVSDIFILGNHNLENVLAAVSISYLAGIKPEIISKAVSEFRGVEHRVEYVGNILGVDCFNDSKGTNPEASIVAVTSMKKPTILIAGGQNKGSEFDEFVKTFDNNLKLLVLLGETKYIIKETAERYGFTRIVLVNDMDEAVDVSFKNLSVGDALLLSPACASWDMYDSFEVRGNHFKNLVLKRK